MGLGQECRRQQRGRDLDGLLDASTTAFDYGCGHGEDVDLLAAQGIACAGWDPVFRPPTRADWEARLRADGAHPANRGDGETLRGMTTQGPYGSEARSTMQGNWARRLPTRRTSAVTSWQPSRSARATYRQS
jgi:hypothetical protein